MLPVFFLIRAPSNPSWHLYFKSCPDPAVPSSIATSMSGPPPLGPARLWCDPWLLCPLPPMAGATEGFQNHEPVHSAAYKWLLACVHRMTFKPSPVWQKGLCVTRTLATWVLILGLKCHTVVPASWPLCVLFPLTLVALLAPPRSALAPGPWGACPSVLPPTLPSIC